MNTYLKDKYYYPYVGGTILGMAIGIVVGHLIVNAAENTDEEVVEEEAVDGEKNND